MWLGCGDGSVEGRFRPWAQATLKSHGQQLEAAEQAHGAALREQRTKAEARRLAAIEEAEKDKEAAIEFAEAELKQWQNRYTPFADRPPFSTPQGRLLYHSAATATCLQSRVWKLLKHCNR